LLAKLLLHWHIKHNTRQLPWKNESNPYKIWLSEILLQQTKAEAVIPYYTAFIHKYPTVTALANAKETELFKLWQGLGYYNRCRNLLATAKQIVQDFDGVFPANYQTILSLKGIGPYTASAIASFAFGLPYAVVDGNVYRILARLYADATPIDTTLGKIVFQDKATAQMPPKQAAAFNQAIMDFGATICKPKAALCIACPLQKICKAYQTNTVYNYPVKSKKLLSKTRHFHYLVYDDGANLYLHKRNAKDVWQDLHEFELLESDNETLPNNPNIKHLAAPIILQQQLTHQKIIGYFYITPNKPANTSLLKVNYKQLHKYAVPKLIADFLKQTQYLPS
jgi:A/G-specific adenine glycosylase